MLLDANGHDGVPREPSADDEQKIPVIVPALNEPNNIGCSIRSAWASRANEIIVVESIKHEYRKNINATPQCAAGDR
jgi:tRNA G18 (ribose-2'-O)-methylase SpoU